MVQISVIIPTYNRSISLRQALDCLTRQTLSYEDFEVVIADDGSSDDTGEVASGPYPFSVNHCWQANQGSAAARNLGAKSSRGQVLAYIDDDIFVEPAYLQTLLAAHQRHDRAVIQGSLVTVPPENPTPFQRVYAEIFSTPDLTGDQERKLGFFDCLSGFFSIKRDHFFEIGAMQDVGGDGRTAWGDVDFGFRAVSLGFEVIQVGGARGYHHDASLVDLWSFVRRWERAAQSALILFNRYPQMADQIEMFEDKGPVQWGKDSVPLVLSKGIHGIAATKPVISSLPYLVQWTERMTSNTKILRPLYRTVLGIYLTKGYRSGLRRISGRASLFYPTKTLES